MFKLLGKTIELEDKAHQLTIIDPLDFIAETAGAERVGVELTNYPLADCIEVGYKLKDGSFLDAFIISTADFFAERTAEELELFGVKVEDLPPMLFASRLLPSYATLEVVNSEKQAALEVLLNVRRLA
jgi:hypothetical protein